MSKKDVAPPALGDFILVGNLRMADRRPGEESRRVEAYWTVQRAAEIDDQGKITAFTPRAGGDFIKLENRHRILRIDEDYICKCEELATLEGKEFKDHIEACHAAIDTLVPCEEEDDLSFLC